MWLELFFDIVWYHTIYFVCLLHRVSKWYSYFTNLRIHVHIIHVLLDIGQTLTIHCMFLSQGQNDYLGVVITKPLVRMTSDSDSSILDWFTITRYDKPAGEVLAGFELIRVSFHYLWKTRTPGKQSSVQMTETNELYY